MIEIVGDTADLQELVGGLKVGEKVLQKATISALNKTITSVRAELVRMVTAEFKVRAKDVRAEIGLSRAHARGQWVRLEAKLLGEGSPGIPLYRFGVLPRRSPSTKRLKSGDYRPLKGVSVMVRKGKRKTVTGAFVATMPSGHVGVFQRASFGSGNVGWWANHGRAIKELYGPSPVKMLASDRYHIPLEDFAGERFEKNMEHEADFFMQKMGLR